MSAQPVDPAPVPAPDTGSYDVIHLGGETAAVVLPIDEFRRLRALEKLAPAEMLEDAAGLAAFEEWDELKAAGKAVSVPMDEVRRRLGLDR